MTTFRGKRACTCLAQWLPVFEAELKRRGIVKSSIDVAQLIGGAVASGGTHATGGAFDIWQHDATTVKVAREMGAAAWARTRAQGFDPHTHGVLNGCPHNGPARYQIAALKAGYNGLGAGGRGGRDDGPAPRTLRTWQQGIAWAKAQTPANTRTTTFDVATMNIRGKTSGFPIRVPVIRARVLKYLPHFLVIQEAPPASRAILSGAIRTKLRMTSNGHNKTQYALTNKRGWTKIKSAKYSLGNNRHAVAVRYRHRTSGADLVIATPHLSWEHSAAKNRATEARALISFLRRDFNGIPWLIAGDLNDSHKSIGSRHNDTSGDVFKAAGLHDLYYDCAENKKHNREYNTAHNNTKPAPKSGIHIDRFWGTSQLKGIEWTNDVHTGRRASDHWLVNMTLRLTHPEN